MSINTVSLYNLDSAEIEYEVCESQVKIKTPSHEEGFGLIVKNKSTASDADFIIKGGNSVMAMGDTFIKIPKGCDMLINLKDTGRYKNVYGEDAGYIVIEVENVTPDNISLFPFSL